MAVVVGEAAVRIRGDADAGEIRKDVEPAVAGAMEDAGESGADAFSAKMAAGIAAVGIAVGAGFAESLEQSAMGDKLAAQMGASGQYAADLGQMAGDLYAGGYGEGMEDINESMRAVIQSGVLMGDETNAQIEGVTASAMNLATAFDVDVGDAATAAGRLVSTGLAANAEEAMDIVTAGFQRGADRGGDFLDVLNEYGTTFSEVGLTGAQATGMINQALDAGIPNADFAADALREMGIIGREGGDAARESLESLGLSADEYFSAMQEGGPAASAALGTVLDALAYTEDPAKRSAAAVNLVGTQYEDLGDAILAMNPGNAVQMLGDVTGAAEKMGTTLNDNASANLSTFYRNAQQVFVDLLGNTVVPIIENVVTWLSSHLGPAVETVGGFIADKIVPPLKDLVGWLGQNSTLMTILAYTVGTVLVAALGVWGTRSLIESAKSVFGWFSTAAASSTSAGAQQKSALQVVAGWIWMGAQALLQGIKIAAVWTAQVVASAVSGAASMAVQVARVVAGWVLMGAQSLLQAARMAAAWVIAMGPIGWIIAAVVGLVALVIANWDTIKQWTVTAWEAVVNAVKAAWDWIVGAVQAAVDFLVNLFMNFTLVGIIISHWDEIVAFTKTAWQAVSDAVGAGVQWIVDFVTGLPGRIWAVLSGFGAWLGGIFSTAWTWAYNAVLTGAQMVIDYIVAFPGNFVSGLLNIGAMLGGIFSTAWTWVANVVRTGVDNVLSFVTGLPGRIWNALRGLGSLLVGLGGDLIRGLVNGISNAASFVGDVARNVVNAVIGFINDQVIGRINNLLDFTIMGVHVNPPDIPRIPRLHEGGVFDSGRGEGLAVLRDDELVATPEQRRVADDLLRGLLAGRLPGAAPAAATTGQAVTINEHVYAAPGESAASIAARTTQGVVWNLNSGITRRVGVGSEA